MGQGTFEGKYATQGKGYRHCIPRVDVSVGEKVRFVHLPGSRSLTLTLTLTLSLTLNPTLFLGLAVTALTLGPTLTPNPNLYLNPTPTLTH